MFKLQSGVGGLILPPSPISPPPRNTCSKSQPLPLPQDIKNTNLCRQIIIKLDKNTKAKMFKEIRNNWFNYSESERLSRSSSLSSNIIADSTGYIPTSVSLFHQLSNGSQGEHTYPSPPIDQLVQLDGHISVCSEPDESQQFLFMFPSNLPCLYLAPE